MFMKKTLIFSWVVVASLLPLAASAASWSPGDLFLVRVGDGVSTLASSAGPVSLLEVGPSGGSVIQSVDIPSGSGGLQVSGTATSEGELLINSDLTSVTLTGYVPPFGGSGSLSSRTYANAPRGYVTVGFDGTVSSPTTLPSPTYSGQNIRSGFVSGSSAWFSGSGTTPTNGLVYYNGSASSTVQGINSRVLGYYNGNLFYSTGSGTTGIYKYNGLPTTATTSTAFLTGASGQGTSPYDFTFSPDGKTLYVADDAIGVQKFTNGGSWSLAYNLTPPSSVTANKAYGLAVDFTGPNPVVYWTTPNDLYKVTDVGYATNGASILSAGANFAFRGLEIDPIPEPSTAILLVLGVAGLLGRRWYNTRRSS